MSRTAPICYDGTGELPARRRVLRAGPLVVEYDAGELRYVRLGGREVIRRWYVAVRDRNWGTIPGRISEERVEQRRDEFAVHFIMEHRQTPIDFTWQGSITGRFDGTIAFRMAGEAGTRFERNRIGFCILHPIRECAGAACRYEQGDGTIAEASFPRSIAPQNMFHELRRFAHEVAPGTWAELEFAGDLFEMEDQRNWIDASFKTFCTPLRLPFPVAVEAGQEVEQAVTLRLRGAVDEGARPATDSPIVKVCPDVIATHLPTIGLVIAEETGAPSDREIDRLKALGLDHLRVDLKLAGEAYPDLLRLAGRLAGVLQCGLEVAVTVTDRADVELSELVTQLESLRPTVVHWLIFHASEWATSTRWIERARARLGAYDPSIPIVSGSAANFTELNRNRPPGGLLDGVCYSVHPQEHASDNVSLVETCAAIRDTLQTAAEFSASLPVSVTPITLRRRVNPYATGPAPEVLPGSLPPQVDLRQMSLLGAVWTLGSLKSLAEGGAATTTWYETVGWLGVMEREAGCALPDQFPSRPGMVFPLYHVLADACMWRSSEVLMVDSSDPLRIATLALRGPEGVRLMVGNLTPEPATVTITELGPLASVLMLDETTFDVATQSPEVFRRDPGSPQRTPGGRLDLALAPFAYARIISPDRRTADE